FDYEDDGYYKRAITYNPARKTISLEEVEGSFSSKFNQIKVVLHGFRQTSRVKLNGSNTRLEDDFVSFIDPITRFDPQGVANPVEGYEVKSMVVPNDNGRIVLTY